METKYKEGDFYWIIDQLEPEKEWQVAKRIEERFETLEVFVDHAVVGPRIEPPPLPKKEEPPQGVEAADALMAIFGYERVETKGNEVRYKAK